MARQSRDGAGEGVLLLVGVGRMGLPYLRAAQRLGFSISAVESRERQAGIADAVDHLTVTRGESDEAWAEAALLAAGDRPPVGVVAFSEPQVMGAALVQDRLGLPGPSLRASLISRNKALQRAHFLRAGIGQPGFIVVDDLTACRDWALRRLPVVLKPLSSAGSLGVQQVTGVAEYDRAAAERTERLLVEEAINGPEYSWEALISGGRVWFANVTAKETTGPPFFVEVAHRTAPELSNDAIQVIRHLGDAVLREVAMDTGIVHLEFRMDVHGPKVMEVAVRTPGDYLMDLLGLTWGLDWYEMVVRLAVGLDLPEPPAARPLRYAASYFLAAEPGLVTAITGLAETRALPGVVTAEASLQPGTVVGPTRSSGQRAGHVVLAAQGPEARDQLLQQARDTFVVITRDPAESAGSR